MKLLRVPRDNVLLLRFNKGNALLMALCCASVLVYLFLIGNSYYDNSLASGEALPRWGADSTTYYQIGKNFGILGGGLVSLRGNFLGPMLLLFGMGFNGFLILVANVAMLVAAYELVVRTLDVRRSKLAVFFAFNPLVFASLLLVNKEIIALLSTAFFLVYMKTGRKLPFWISLIIGLCARWQQTLVLCLFAFIHSRLNPLRRNPALTLCFLVGAISVLYPVLFARYFDDVFAAGTLTSQLEGPLGVILTATNYLQSHYLFILAFPLKALLNLVGNVFRVASFFADFPGYAATDLYNNLFILGHQVAMCVVLSLLLIRRRAGVRYPEIQLAILFLIVMSVDKMVQYRYVFPVYLLCAVQLSKEHA